MYDDASAYTGRKGKATIILELVVDGDLSILHAYFGLSTEYEEDIEVIYKSNVFSLVLEGKAPPSNFAINRHKYNTRYFLCDGIYTTLVKAIHKSKMIVSERLFPKRYEAAHKNL